MPTCPNCGEIVMKGDPYCPNCGFLFNKSDRKNLVNEFKHFHFYAYDWYNIGEYELSMNALGLIFGDYKGMSNYQKSRVKHMLERDWVVDLCCITVNKHAGFYRKAWEIIERMDFDVKICDECDCIYPESNDFCIKCGKPLRWL